MTYTIVPGETEPNWANLGIAKLGSHPGDPVKIIVDVLDSALPFLVKTNPAIAARLERMQ